MLPEAVEELIEAAMAERLATIQAGTVIYNEPSATVEYWMTPWVTRELLPIDQYKADELETGVLGVMRASGSLIEVNPREPDGEHAHRVAVWGYVSKTPDMIAGTALNRLASDARRCLMTDRYLGGLVMDLRPDGPRDTDDAAREPRAFFRQHWVARMSEAFPQGD
jgi:hypothetical protein